MNRENPAPAALEGSSKPNERLSLKGNFGWILGGNAIYGMSQALALVVVGRWLGPAALGDLALALAVVGPISLLLDLKLRSVLATDAERDYRLGVYLAARLMGIALLAVIVALFGLIFRWGVSLFIVVMFVAAGKGWDSASDILYGYQQRRERMRSIAVSRGARGVLQLLLLTVLAGASGSLAPGVAAWAAAPAAVFLAYDLPITRRALASDRALAVGRFTDDLTPAWGFAALRSLVWLALPLGLAVFLGSLWVAVPRYVVSVQLGSADLGRFAAAASPLVIGGTVVSALALVAAPRLAALHARRSFPEFDGLMMRLIGSGALVGAVGAVAAFLIGERLARLVFGELFGDLGTTLTIISIAVGMQFGYVFLGTGLQAMRVFWVNLPIQFVSLAVVFVASLTLVPSLGIEGAAIAMLTANLAELGGYSLAFGIARKRTRPDDALPHRPG